MSLPVQLFLSVLALLVVFKVAMLALAAFQILRSPRGADSPFADRHPAPVPVPVRLPPPRCARRRR